MTPREIKDKIQAHTSSAADLKRSLDNIQLRCTHEWSAVEYIPDYQPGFRTAGDPPGTMGVDWRGPVDVPSKTTKRWRRACLKCELEQVTTQTKRQTVNGSIPGTSGQVDVPCFPGDR